MNLNIRTIFGNCTRCLTWGVLLIIVYLVSGKLGLMLALPPGYTSAIFPPAGIAIAAALIAGKRTLLPIFIGSLLLNIWVAYSASQHINSMGWLAATAIACASALQAGAGGWILRRVIGHPVALDRGHEILRLLFFIPLICLISATLSVTSLWLMGSVLSENFSENWFFWWMGDTLGVVVMLPIVMTVAGQPSEIWRSRRLTVAAPILLIFSLFVVIFLKTNQWENENSLSDFRQISQQAFNQVHTKLEEQMVLLDDLTELFNHDKQGYVGRDEFHRFVQKSLQRFSMIQALEWAPKVTAENRASFEAAQRADLPQFQIRERDAARLLVRAGDRATYYPVTYVEPAAGNESSIGYDLASSITRREALADAVKTGEIVMTKAVQLMQDTRPQASVLILSAISSQHEKSGVVLIVIKMDDFMNALLSDTQSMLYTRLIDMDEKRVLYDNFVADSSQALGEYSFVFGTRHYQLLTAPTPAYFKQHRGWQSIAVLTTGLVGIGLMAMLLLLGTGYTARIAKEVKDKTKKLTESETILGYILNTSPIAVRIATQRGRKIVFCNARYETLIANKFALGDDPKKYYARPEEYESLLLELERGNNVLNREIELRIPDDSTVHVLSSYLLMEYQGEAAVLGWFYDITERKQSEDRFRAAVEAAPNGMMIVNARGEIVILNSQISTLFGYTEHELIGQSVNLLLPKIIHEAHTAHVKKFIDHPVKRAMGKGRDLFGLHQSGRQIQVEVGLSPLQINGEAFVLASVVDITERQQTLAQLRVTAEQLEQANAKVEEERAQLAARVQERTAQLQFANHAKDSFLATMSHEIRTPLGGLLGMMELLSLSQLNAKQTELLSTAQTSGNSLLRIVNDILDWSKIEAGKLELSLSPTAIPQVLNGVVATYTQLANDKDIRLQLNIDPALLDTEYLFDPLRISQVINNFTSNAIKFTERGIVEIRAEIMAREEGRDTLRFCVQDSGVGIAKEQLPRLFQHYEQGSADTARMYGGTGLGLSICRRLAELMGGELSVESQSETGSTFCLTISLPVVSRLARPLAQAAYAPELLQSDERSTRPLVVNGQAVAVLIVDDHPINRMLLKQQLDLLGVQIESAVDGAQALSKWQNGHFDLVITDCHMPEMDGYELTRNIRAIEQTSAAGHIPIIAWTANVLAEESDRCSAAGMDDLLTKPTELADLRAMLVKWLTPPNSSSR